VEEVMSDLEEVLSEIITEEQERALGKAPLAQNRSGRNASATIVTLHLRPNDNADPSEG
jgi:hypothetical protein